MPEIDSAVGKIADSQALYIHCEKITKRFGSISANDNINCDIRSGSIHAVMGENGAGKSTLMKIFAGYYQPDSGSIYLNNQPVNFKSPAEARRCGIGMVHQQFTLVPSLTVLENVLLGHPDTPIILDPRKQGAAVDERAAKHGIKLDLYSSISKLTMAERQKVEILKLIWRDANIMILDEPTSQLAPFEANEILETMDHLAKQGKIVILITHHIDEILKFSSKITLLRRGKLETNLETKQVNAEELARLMIGKKTIKNRDNVNSFLASGLIHVKLQNVSVKKSTTHRALHNINLELKAGEVHGIAGIAGSGQEELCALLCGHLVPEAGKLFIDDKQEGWGRLSDPVYSCAYIPSEPKKASLSALTLWENLLLRSVHQKEFLSGLFINKKAIARMASERIGAFDVRPQETTALGGSLSGGNLQRLILAREFYQPSSFMVASNPTAGLDLAMSLKIREELRQYASTGKSVLLISPDMDELIRTCDRISVIFGGQIVCTEDVGNLSAESLGLLMGGNKQAMAVGVN